MYLYDTLIFSWMIFPTMKRLKNSGGNIGMEELGGWDALSYEEKKNTPFTIIISGNYKFVRIAYRFSCR